MNEKTLIMDLSLSRQRTKKLELLLAKKRHQANVYKKFHKQSKFFKNHFIYGFFLPIDKKHYPLNLSVNHPHFSLKFFTFNDELHHKDYFLFNADDSETLYAFFDKYRDEFWMSNKDINYIKETNPNIQLMKMNINDYYRHLQMLFKSSFDYYYKEAKKEIANDEDCL